MNERRLDMLNYIMIALFLCSLLGFAYELNYLQRKWVEHEDRHVEEFSDLRNVAYSIAVTTKKMIDKCDERKSIPPVIVLENCEEGLDE